MQGWKPSERAASDQAAKSPRACLLDAVGAAMEAGERAAKRGGKGNGARWAKAHPLTVSLEQLVAEAYALGYTLQRDRVTR